MAKRATGIEKMKKSHSKKTAKRLAVKHERIESLKGRKNATKNYR